MTAKAKWSDLVSMDRARTVAAANALLPAWVSLVIVILIGWQLAKIFWLLVPANDAGTPVRVPAGQLQQSSDIGAANVEQIAGAHLFGMASAEDAPALMPTAGDGAPDTRQQLTLRGTHASTEETLAMAVISDNNEEKVYRIGDPVATGAKLHAVFPARVLLNENGQITKLDLPREFAESSPPPTRRNSIAANRTSTGAQGSIQQVVAQNVSRLADVIRPTPYFQGGQQQGYRVYPGRDRKKFAALGLRPGDLIKEIDGQSLTDPQQAMQIFQSLGTADQVSVTVERNGTPETIVLRTEQLDLGKEQTK